MTFFHRPLATSLAATTLLALAACGSDDGNGDTPEPPQPPAAQAPNILFIIMDDVGIDQMASFGYGGTTPPSLPNLDAVAAAGLRFRNTWGMPECSPARAALLAGRYPFRTGIQQAIGPNDLANSQVSPYEVTVPKLMREAGYTSAMFGKFHLAGPENNEAGHATPAVLGWDHFYGWVGGLPGSIDGSAGGIAAERTYACGFVPGAAAGGADRGACYQANGTCQPLQHTSLLSDPPGLQCLDSGGIFVPGEVCGTPPASLNFERENAYYVSPLVIVDQGNVEVVPLSDPRSRGYRTRIEADAAIDWIRSRAGSTQPWMATVSFSAAHTPLQQPPISLLASGSSLGEDALDCRDPVQGRVLQNRMTEAMDSEFGRILVETGLATRDAEGRLQYDPAASNTVIVVSGDNGSFGASVKLPFNGQLAKGTAYQTGVWIPLIVAGPDVTEPGRDIEHMVNAVDVYQLFGELAGLDAHQLVPRPLDSAPMLPYLADPAQPSLRTTNFTMGGYNVQANGGRNGPCVINNASCTQIPVSKGVCEDNGGVWWGAGYDDPSVVANGGAGYLTCSAVNQALYQDGQAMIDILPEASMAIRNDSYKLVRNATQHYEPVTDTFDVLITNELYQINQAAPRPLLDNPDRNLLTQQPLPADVAQVYQQLTGQLETLLASEPECPGDGNRDGKVDAEDVANWTRLARDWGLSSVYDARIDGVHDGLTNHADGMVVQQNLGLRCAVSHGNS